MNILFEGIGNISLTKLRMKKLLLSILFVPCLTNCSSFNSGNIAPGYIDTFKAINNVVFGYSQDQISSELIANIPYASMLLKIGKGPTGLMILEQKINGELVWISADGIYVITKNGKIIRTKGLINDLLKVEFNDLNFENTIMNPTKNPSSKMYYSFDKPSLNNLEVEVSYQLKSIEEVNIMDRKMDLRRIEETIENKYLRWKAKNIYWIDNDNVIWQSEQTISPKLPKIFIQLTKKPS